MNSENLCFPVFTYWFRSSLKLRIGREAKISKEYKGEKFRNGDTFEVLEMGNTIKIRELKRIRHKIVHGRKVESGDFIESAVSTQRLGAEGTLNTSLNEGELFNNPAQECTHLLLGLKRLGRGPTELP